MAGCNYSRTAGLYEFTYRGVFVSPFDYDMALYNVKLARLILKYGGQITEKQKVAAEKISRLESLGGIQGHIDMAVAKKELQDFINSVKN